MTTIEIYAGVAILIGSVVRLLKSDTPIPVTIPPRWRPFLALGLGLVASVFDMLARGTPVGEAVLSGLLAGAAAIASHDAIVDGARDGRDIGQSKASMAKDGSP